MKVIRGADVRFECAVKTDATTPVTTTWMKGTKPVTIGWRWISTMMLMLPLIKSKENRSSRMQFPGSPWMNQTLSSVT